MMDSGIVRAVIFTESLEIFYKISYNTRTVLTKNCYFIKLDNENGSYDALETLTLQVGDSGAFFIPSWDTVLPCWVWLVSEKQGH